MSFIAHRWHFSVSTAAFIGSVFAISDKRLDLEHTRLSYFWAVEAPHVLKLASLGLQSQGSKKLLRTSKAKRCSENTELQNYHFENSFLKTSKECQHSGNRISEHFHQRKTTSSYRYGNPDIRTVKLVYLRVLKIIYASTASTQRPQQFYRHSSI